MNQTAKNPILLVDDSVDDMNLVLAALRRANVRNRVIVLRDGREALDYLYGREPFAGREDPLFVLLDIKMQRVNGLEVLQRMKADDALRTIPVVMFTSSNREADVGSSYRLGVNAYVVKPVDFSLLIESLACLSRFWTAVNRPLLPSAA